MTQGTLEPPDDHAPDDHAADDRATGAEQADADEERFEALYARLEAAAARIEAGDLTLEQSVGALRGGDAAGAALPAAARRRRAAHRDPPRGVRVRGRQRVTLRLGWFTTARGSGSRAMYETVADAISAGDLDAEIAVVFCNRDRGENETTDRFLALVRSNGHPLVTRSSVRYRRAVEGERSRPGAPLPVWREHYDRQVAEELAQRPFELGVLAGYMLIFTPEFAAQHPLLNLHPALPDGPSGTWREVIRALIRQCSSVSGVMLHLAIAEVDTGAGRRLLSLLAARSALRGIVGRARRRVRARRRRARGKRIVRDDSRGGGAVRGAAAACDDRRVRRGPAEASSAASSSTQAAPRASPRTSASRCARASRAQTRRRSGLPQQGLVELRRGR